MVVSGQLHALAASPLGRDLPVPNRWTLDGPQSQSGHGGEDKSLALSRNWTPVIISIAIYFTDWAMLILLFYFIAFNRVIIVPNTQNLWGLTNNWTDIFVHQLATHWGCHMLDHVNIWFSSFVSVIGIYLFCSCSKCFHGRMFNFFVRQGAYK
jgi:hypothetical protein